MFGFRGKHDVVTDPRRIGEVLTRGVENVIPRELALKKLSSGEQLRVYFGIDPNSAKLHLGHTVPLRKLKQFSELGHHIIFVVGSFTAMIGDPTDRDAERTQLSREEVRENFKGYRRQAEKVLDFSRVEVRYNHEWLDTVDFEKIVSLASKFTVQQMLQRDMFERRMRDGKPIRLHEFLYPLMVGYDSVVLDVDAELGGSDQEFNMLAGRHLQAAFGGRDKFVLTTRLIEGTDGRKMSKSFGNCVYITDTPTQMFGKLMSMRDNLVPIYLDVCTDFSAPRQEEILALHPKEAKMALAGEIVRMYHGEDGTRRAKEDFIKTFSEGNIPEGIQELRVPRGVTLANVLVGNGVVESKSEFRRLVKQRAIHNTDADSPITDDSHSIQEPLTLKVGKRRFVRIVPE
ncbi:tyrosine--tRNA ligase [Candidatus Wolfebacteria bacterium]|nr:tyrosine--tRNA ligase [Candidatus Wolfebacteria bacterium]